MAFTPGFYVDRLGRARVSIEGHNSIGFKDHEVARVIHRRIAAHLPATVAQLKAVTGLNDSCIAKLLRAIEDA
jgi:hypothetical protein